MATVLVVEDNPLNMKLAVFLLRQAGHSARCAIDAESALAMVRTAGPDLILMDLQLPRMDGLAATALLKSDPATAGIPVIALSATSQAEDRQNIGRLVFDAYLSKPLHYPQLLATIERLLGRPAPPASVSVADAATVAAGDTGRAQTPVDLDVLRQLVGLDPGTILEFSAGFIDSAERIRLDVRHACGGRQAHAASRSAHGLRASALMIGAGRLASVCAAMEHAGRTGDADAVCALLPEFEVELDSVFVFLQSRESPASGIGMHSPTRSELILP